MKVATGLILIISVLIVSAVFAEETAFVYDDHGRRDPFWPLVSSAGAIINYGSDLMIADMILEGIIADPANNGNYAIINGVVVSENDAIGLFVVKSIGKNIVVLNKGQENFVLKLKKEE